MTRLDSAAKIGTVLDPRALGTHGRGQEPGTNKKRLVDGNWRGAQDRNGPGIQGLTDLLLGDLGSWHTNERTQGMIMATGARFRRIREPGQDAGAGLRQGLHYQRDQSLPFK